MSQSQLDMTEVINDDETQNINEESLNEYSDQNDEYHALKLDENEEEISETQLQYIM